MSAGNKDGIVLNQDRSVEAQLQRAKEERQKKLKKQKRRKYDCFIDYYRIRYYYDYQQKYADDGFYHQPYKR